MNIFYKALCNCTVVLYLHVLIISDLDHCASGPCYNGGTCRNRKRSYTCTCKTGYKGAQCEVEGGLLLLKCLSTKLCNVECYKEIEFIKGSFHFTKFKN